MLSNYFKNPVIRFLLSIFLLYILWFLVYNLWLHPQEKLDLFVINATISICQFFLKSMGYTVFTGVERVIGVDGTGGLWIGDNCNAMSLFGLFAGFIIAFPGKWWKKLIYIPVGIVLVELMNVLRIICLAILDTHSRAWTEFNHTYTFTIIIYGFIFLLWMIWVNRFSSKLTRLN